MYAHSLHSLYKNNFVKEKCYTFFAIFYLNFLILRIALLEFHLLFFLACISLSFSFSAANLALFVSSTQPHFIFSVGLKCRLLATLWILRFTLLLFCCCLFFLLFSYAYCSVGFCSFCSALRLLLSCVFVAALIVVLLPDFAFGYLLNHPLFGCHSNSLLALPLFLIRNYFSIIFAFLLRFYLALLVSLSVSWF